MRLIDAEELQRVFNEVSTSILRMPKMTKDMEHIVRACIMTTEIIKDAPTIEAEPVKHGEWIKTDGCENQFKCSECGRTVTTNTSIVDPADFEFYCYNCGAKMDGDSE